MSATAAAEHGEHHDGPLEWPEEVAVGKATVAKVGMWIFLLSDALMFAGFLLAYGIMRGGSASVTAADGTILSAWRCTEAVSAVTGCAIEPTLGINFTAGLTFLLICSSVTMVLSFAAASDGDNKGAMRYLGLTIIGGLLFLVGQYEEYFGIFGHGLTNEGLTFAKSHYANTFYMITSFHGMHVATGVLIMIITYIRYAMGKYKPGDTNHLEVVGLFWHFVDLVWILVFTFVYLL